MLISPSVLLQDAFLLVSSLSNVSFFRCLFKIPRESLYLDQAILVERNVNQVEMNMNCTKRYEVASNELYLLGKNAVVPTILITTFAICWPAAIVLTAMYLGFEGLHAYSQHSDTNAAKQLVLVGPEEEGDKITWSGYDEIGC